jgi:hypothetical protein
MPRPKPTARRRRSAAPIPTSTPEVPESDPARCPPARPTPGSTRHRAFQSATPTVKIAAGAAAATPTASAFPQLPSFPCKNPLSVVQSQQIELRRDVGLAESPAITVMSQLGQSRQTPLARKRSHERNSLKADTVLQPSRVAHVRPPQ